MKLTLGVLVATGALATLVVVPVSAQTPQATQPSTQEQHVHPAPDAAAQDKPAGETHAMHMMMANMQASHAKLQGLVEKMHAAKGAQKTDAIATLVTEMVQSQHAMHEAMAAHMAECPMMNMGNVSKMPMKP